MTAHAADARTSTADLPASRATEPARPVRSLRDLLAIDARPGLVAFTATAPGQVLLFTLFFGMLACAIDWRMAALVTLGAAARAQLVSHRDWILLLATCASLLLEPAWYMDASLQSWLRESSVGSALDPRDIQRILTGAYLGIALLGLRYVAQHPQSFFARRPVVCLLASLAALSSIAAMAAPYAGPSFIWLVLSIQTLAVYMWFLCYAVMDQRAPKRGSLVLALGVQHPFWGSSATPIGKGPSYLARLGGKTGEELAVIQLKGLKLLIWSFALFWIARGIEALAWQRLGVPRLAELLAAFTEGRSPSIGLGWLALIVTTALAALELAVWGHRVVACARVAGFALKRNTWRPLEARSLADFWNRYYFYFKELLVDFFFYPTFFRVFKKQPRLRVFCATFMAAGVGNAIYHFVRDIHLVFALGPAAALHGYTSYAFYCLLLAGGIALSQARSGGEPSRLEQGLLVRIRAFCWVWGFVICLQIFGSSENRDYSLHQRLSLMAYQFGVSP